MSNHLKLPTILIVADNPSIRFWLKKHLDDHFFVLSAETPKEALDALYSPLDFIIIDAEFERCDALELSEKMYQQAAKSGTPIFLITGKLKKSFREKAKKAGITEFLSANLDLDELLSRIESGKKRADVRQKTEEAIRAVRIPTPSGSSLKHKFVLNDEAVRLLSQAKKKNVPIALLFMQIDAFDTLNKPATTFQNLGEFIGELLREEDVLIPSSEGKFVLLLANNSPTKAKTIAERLQAKIERQNFDLTVSIAISSLDASEEGFHKMLNSLIKSLNTQKNTNLIISFDPENP